MRSLAELPLFEGLPSRRVKAAENAADWFSLPAGWPLFEECDPAEHIYFVLTGSLGAFQRTPDGRNEFLGHIRPGEPVGEMSLLAEEPHASSVFALRDTELVRLPRDTFLKLGRASPEIMRKLTRIVLVRLRKKPLKTLRSEPKVFALTAASPTIDLRLRSRVLAAGLEKLGLRVAIVGEEADRMSTGFFDQLEAEHDIVILISRIEDFDLVPFVSEASRPGLGASPPGCPPLRSVDAGRDFAGKAVSPRRCGIDTSRIGTLGIHSG